MLAREEPSRELRRAVAPQRVTPAPPRGRLSRNLVANVAGFVANIAVGVFFTPYLIQHLGVAAYGVIPLATTVTSYLSVVTLVLNAAVGRYITVALECGDVEEARRFFNTSLFGSLGLAALMLVPGIWFAFHAQSFFRIPAGEGDAASSLLACTATVVILSVVSAPFEVATFCRNRFDVRNLIGIAAIAIRVGAVVAVFALATPSIAWVGAAYVAAAIVSLTASVRAWRVLTPELRISASCFNRRALGELVSSGGWVAVSQIGTLLLLSIDLLVVNRLFGAEESGRYASVLQWPILLRSVALTLAGVLSPSMIALYARGDTEGLIRYARAAVRALGLVIALPVGLLAGLSTEVLGVWLGSSFTDLAPLLVIMVLPLCANLGYLPLHNVSTATNKVRVPGLVQVGAGVANLALALALAGPLGWGARGVAAAGVIVLTLRNVVFTPVYGARIIGRPLASFMKELPVIVAAGLVVAAASWGAARLVDLSSVVALVAYCAVAGVAYAVVLWVVILSPEEKRAFRR